MNTDTIISILVSSALGSLVFAASTYWSEAHPHEFITYATKKSVKHQDIKDAAIVFAELFIVFAAAGFAVFAFRKGL